MEVVARSAASQLMQSPTSTSAMSPSEISCEKPTPSPAAQSTMDDTTAPDCEISPSPPGFGARWAKLALRLTSGDKAPMVFGPTIRIRCGRAASSMACFCVASRPAVMTTAALQPISASSRVTFGTAPGGVTMTARSGASGRRLADG